MTLDNLYQNLISLNGQALISYVKKEINEIKLLFLNSKNDSESLTQFQETFFILYQKQLTDNEKTLEVYEALIYHFALYFKASNIISLVVSCTYLIRNEALKSRLNAYVYARRYNDYKQHITNFKDYLNILSKGQFSEFEDYTPEILEDLNDYYHYGLSQLTNSDNLHLISDFKDQFKEEDLLSEFSLLIDFNEKITNRILDVAVVPLKDKIYEPSDFTENLFDEKFLNPIKHHPQTIWYSILLGFSKEEIRAHILKYGLADFDQDYGTLKAEDRIKLYCYFNLRKHYFTSLSIFERFEAIPKYYDSIGKIKFIDIGCGPATAAIAFIDHLIKLTGEPVRFDYYGNDISSQMLHAAKYMLSNDGINNMSHLYFMKNLNDMPLTDLVNGSCILINTCYLFASPRLDVNDLVNFIKKIRQITTLPTYLIFQNPNDQLKNINYEKFKQLIGSFELKYSGVDRIFYNNKRSSLYKPTYEVVYYELLKL